MILILLSFVFFPYIYMCVCARACALNFSSHNDEHNLLFCMHFFSNFKIFSLSKLIFSSFFWNQTHKQDSSRINLFFFFCISWNPREKETKKTMQLDPTRTLPWRTKIICNWSLPPYTYNKTRTRSINQNEIDQSFEVFASSIKNLVCESLNYTKSNKAYNGAIFERIS
jgi:hypothetical protein